MPITCEGCDGLLDLIFSVVFTSWPFIYIGYSRPNSLATFCNAACIAARFSVLLKSTKGSLLNSVLCSFASAVAIIPFSPRKRLSKTSVPPLRGQFAVGFGEDSRVQIYICRCRRRAHQRHVVERRQQHSAIQGVKVQESFQFEIRRARRLSAVPGWMRGEVILGSRTELNH